VKGRNGKNFGDFSGQVVVTAGGGDGRPTAGGSKGEKKIKSKIKNIDFWSFVFLVGSHKSPWIKIS